MCDIIYVILLDNEMLASFICDRIYEDTIFFHYGTKYMILLKDKILNYTQRKEMSRVMRKPVFAYAKTKTQISFAVTAKLISAFVFAIRIVQFLYFLNPTFH